MRERLPVSRYTAAFVVLLACQLAYLYTTFPSAEEYRPAADEGTYFRLASTILDRGLAGFARLGREFIADPELQVTPPPTRIGHVLTAALALRVSRSFRALSALSLTCQGLLCVAMFVFAKRLWGEPVAFVAGVLVMVSPLGAGLARRALMDTDYSLFVILSLFTFVMWATRGGDRRFAWFIAAIAWALLVKETTSVFLPYFFMALVAMKVKRVEHVRWRHLGILTAVPVGIGIAYAVFLGGFGPAAAVFRAWRQANTLETNAALQAYQSGPWYEYFVDSLLLSPMTILAFLLYCGWYLGSQQKSMQTTLIVLFFWVSLVFFALLPQNPRYVVPLDPIVRLGAALMIVTMFAALPTWKPISLVGAAACFFIIATTDLASFRRLFIEDRIYDPVACNLLASRRVCPGDRRPRASIAFMPDDYLAWSLAYYRARDFDEAIQMAHRALILRPDYAEAYNNIGAAYCEIGMWPEAIVALETAVRLQPDLQLARNNLAWARGALAGVRR